jgi:hypothetical protein
MAVKVYTEPHLYWREQVVTEFVWRNKEGDPTPWIATTAGVHYYDPDTGWHRWYQPEMGWRITAATVDSHLRLLLDFDSPGGPTVLRLDGLTIEEV